MSGRRATQIPNYPPCNDNLKRGSEASRGPASPAELTADAPVGPCPNRRGLKSGEWSGRYTI